MVIIYHNPRCKKSRAGLAYLKSKTNDFEIVKYLDDNFTIESFKEVISKTGKSPEQLLRKQEEYYRKNLKGKDLTDNELIKEMVNNPKLIARPIVVKNDKAVLADPLEELDKIL